MRDTHVWPAISSGHECSLVDCWCDHRECEVCGAEETTPFANETCPGKDPWFVEAKRLIHGMGCSEEAARDLALGFLAGSARMDGKTAKEFYEDIRWLYEHLDVTDRMLRSIEADAGTALRVLREQGRR